MSYIKCIQLVPVKSNNSIIYERLFVEKIFSQMLGVNESKMLSNSQNPKSRRISRSQSHPAKEKDRQDVSNPVKEYAEASSIHGIKYITEDGRHHFEK